MKTTANMVADHRAARLWIARGLPATILFLSLGIGSASGADWRQFRGDDRNGVAPGTNSATSVTPPLHWSTTDNVAWMAPLPGRGTSSPIVVGKRVFITCSSGPRQDRLHVIALDADDGRLVWQRQILATGRTICHPMTAVAAPTPASDGQCVVAYFSSNDLVAFDLEGNLLWTRGLTLEHPQSGNDVGLASSPLIAGDTVIVQVECQGDSFAAGFDIATGAERWNIPRPKRANWSSPTLLRGTADRRDDLVLLQSPAELTAIEPATGHEVLSEKASFNEIASAVVDGTTVFLPSDGGIKALSFAGAITTNRTTHEKHRATVPLWSAPKLTFGAASPLVDAGRVYTINRAGVLNCGDATSGTILWQLRLKGAIWGSPVIAGNHMYVVNKDGAGLVVRLPKNDLESTAHGSKDHDPGEIVGEGAIDEQVLASPAIAAGALYIRSDRHLWKIAAHGSH